MPRVAGIVAGVVLALAACGGPETVTTTVRAPTSTTTTTTSPTTTTTRAPTTATVPLTTTTTTTLPLGPARYRLTVDNTWSTATHPGTVPTDAHFSWLAGATHDDSTSLWRIGEPSSPGITQMAETGRTAILVAEVKAADGRAAALEWRWWFCPEATRDSRCGELTVEFDVDPDAPFLSLVSMLGPSPDWFVGVDGLPLLEDGRWRQTAVIALHPYDGGTRSNNRFLLYGRQNDPPEPISEITKESGQLIGPQQIGTLTFTLVDKQ